jgi:hypothetical protein
MNDIKLALKGLDWLAELGLPPDVLAKARSQLQSGSGASSAGSLASRDSAQTQTEPVFGPQKPVQNAFGPQIEPVPDGGTCAAPDGDAPAVCDGTDDPLKPEEIPPELVITPATVTLSPGGSVQYAAKLVHKSGWEIELKTDVTWESSSALIEIDAKGLARVAAVSSGSNTVEITARHLNWETSTIAWVKVPSIDVRKFKTPFGNITYKADFEAQAKPRLESASKAFLLAEKLDNSLDIAVEKLGKAMDKLPPLDKIPAMVAEKTNTETNLEAVHAAENDVGMADAKVLMDTLQGMLTDTGRHVDAAKRHLQNKKDLKGLRELQDRAKAYDEGVDLLANSVKMVAALADPKNPGGMISAAADLFATIAKMENPFAKQASDKQVKLDDAELETAQQELDDAKKSGDEWYDKHQQELINVAKRAQLAKKNWDAVEGKYNTAAGKGAQFNFDMLHAALAAAETVSAAAAKSAIPGDVAVTMAEGLLNEHPVPTEWLADEKKDWITLNTLLSESNKIKSNAGERQDGADSYRTKLLSVLAEAHENMWTQGKP